MLKMKRIFVAMLCLLLALPLCTACGNASQRTLEGVWELTDGEDMGYGFGLKFNKDGTMYYGLSSTDMEGNGAMNAKGGVDVSPMSDEEWEALFEGLGMLYTISYKAKSDTEMDITIKVRDGLGGKESTVVEYQLDGDTLMFDGATYRRVAEK